MIINDYVTTRLLMSMFTKFANKDGVMESITTEDGNPRLYDSHTLCGFAEKVWSNIAKDNDLENAMVEFYRNSLAAGRPKMADTIICKESMIIPDHLERIPWEHDGWFIFNEEDGLVTSTWWHIYGWVPTLCT